MQTRIGKRRTRLKIVEQDVLPRELQRSAPRQVVFNGSGWVSVISAALLFVGGIAGGLLLAEKSRASAMDADLLAATGRRAEAEVFRVRRTRGDSPQVEVYYRYPVGGAVYEGRSRLTRRDPLWRTAAEGSRVNVVYLPSEPGKSWLAGYGPGETPLWLAAVVPALSFAGAALIAYALRKQRHLLTSGRATMARITSATKKSKYDDSWLIEYSWTLFSGAMRSGHVSRSSKPPDAGSFLPIVYDRDNPERHAPYPFSLVRLR